jgi:hypothetical protein
MTTTLQLSHDLREQGVWVLGRSGDRYTALVTCPGCGTALSLSRHTIADDGCVTPSLACPSCGWHDFVVLEGWIPGGMREVLR